VGGWGRNPEKQKYFFYHYLRETKTRIHPELYDSVSTLCALQCVAVYSSRSALQHVVARCSVLQCNDYQHTSVPSHRVYDSESQCCSMLQCVSVRCSALQCVTVWCSGLPCVAVCCGVLQCVAVCCSALQCVAVCCAALRYVAVYCDQHALVSSPGISDSVSHGCSVL